VLLKGEKIVKGFECFNEEYGFMIESDAGT